MEKIARYSFLISHETLGIQSLSQDVILPLIVMEIPWKKIKKDIKF